MESEEGDGARSVMVKLGGWSWCRGICDGDDEGEGPMMMEADGKGVDDAWWANNGEYGAFECPIMMRVRGRGVVDDGRTSYKENNVGDSGA